MKKKLVVGNMKMNPPTSGEMERYLDQIEKEVKDKSFDKTEVVICPPAVYLEKCLQRKMKNIKFGAQNIFWEYQGAYTGEISAPMIKSLGAEYIIVGHSERRKYFGEEENVVNLKLKSILKNGLKAVLCVGESMEERELGKTADVLRKQIEGSLEGISSGKLEYVDLVYEPIWSVGSDNVPTSDEILESKLIIKKALCNLYKMNVVEKMRLLFGGSIAVRFVHQVCCDPAMDGGLVGRESLNPHEFIKIAEIIDKS